MKIGDWIRHQTSSDKGVGDTVKRVTASVGIKPCGGCQKRAEKLNERFPYKREQ